VTCETDLSARIASYDKGLGGIQALKNLQYLELAFTGISDAGLQSLAGMQELKHLGLYGTKVTDAGLKTLSELPKLEELDLRYLPSRMQAFRISAQ